MLFNFGIFIYIIKSLFLFNFHRPNIWISQKAVKEVSFICDGDARVAIGSLQLAIQNKLLEAKLNKTNIDHTKIIIDVDCMKEGLKKSYIAYDKNGNLTFLCSISFYCLLLIKKAGHFQI